MDPANDGTFLPAAVEPKSGLLGLVAALCSGRSDLVRLWTADCYRVRTLQFKFFKQSYFLCNASDAVCHVLRDNHENYDRKSPLQKYWLEPLIGDGLFASDGDLWKKRRRKCAPALKKNRLHNYVPIMTTAATEARDRWLRMAPEKPVDVLNEMALLTSRIISRSVFGDNVTDREASQVVDGFTQYQRIAETLDFALISGLSGFQRLRRSGRTRQAARSAKQVHDVINHIIDRQRAKTGNGRETFLSLFQDAQIEADGCPMGNMAIRNEAIVMFMAGHETTANALAWTWYLLSNCEQSTRRLHEELDSVLGGRIPTIDDVEKLIFTRAIFEEAMRLYPPVPVMARQARERDKIRGKTVEAGTIMLIAPWLLHRHEKCWDDPNAFRPERFLPDAPRPDNFLYIPFSAGHRVCLGINFGLMEGIICIAVLAQKFAPRIAPRHSVELDCNLTLRPKGGLPMLLQRRR